MALPRIWCRGDSTTLGAGSSFDRGYRRALFDLGYRVDFVGTRSDGDWSDNQHDGTPAAQLAAMATFNTANFPGPTITGAEVIIFSGGLNDSNQVGYDGPTFLANYTSVLATFVAGAPQAWIICGFLWDMDPTDPQAANVADANTQIASAVLTYNATATRKIRMWDPRPAVNPYSAAQHYDNLHLNDVGYAAVIPRLVEVAAPVFEAVSGPPVRQTAQSLQRGGGAVPPAHRRQR